MPWSDPRTARPILRYLAASMDEQSESVVEILDLGIGSGSFGKRIKRRIPHPTRLTGVEVWPRYRGRKWACYDEIVIGDIRAFLAEDERTFDFILLTDVLEHFEREDGEEVLAEIRHRARRAAVVSTPTTPYPQGAFLGNPYETHRCTWSQRELAARGGRMIYRTWTPTFSLRPMFSVLGVFVFERAAEQPAS